MPALPSVPGGASVVVNASVLFTIAPGETRTFEAANLAQDRGAMAPSCPGLVWVAAWRATDPLTGTVRTAASRFDLGRGRWGTADMSCASLDLRNDTSVTVGGELAYIIASR